MASGLVSLTREALSRALQLLVSEPLFFWDKKGCPGDEELTSVALCSLQSSQGCTHFQLDKAPWYLWDY